MALRPLPVEIELVIYTGTTLRREFRWIPDGVIPQDFTGWSGDARIGPRGGEALYELSSTDGGVELTTDGKVIVNLTAAETAPLKGTGLFWQVDLTDPGNFVQRLIRGRVTVVRDVEAIIP